MLAFLFIMGALKPGMTVLIKVGADKGKEAVIKEIIDDNYVKIKLIKGKNEVERRINVRHIKIK